MQLQELRSATGERIRNGLLAHLILMAAAAGMPTNTCAGDEEEPPSRFDVYLTADILGGWMNRTTATIHDPPTFDGQGTFEFSGSVTLLAGAGLRYRTENYAYGVEVEWYGHQFDITGAPEPYNEFPYIKTDTWALNARISMEQHQQFKPYLLAGATWSTMSLYETPDIIFYQGGSYTEDTVGGFQAGAGIRIFSPDPTYTKFNLDIGGRFFQSDDLTFRSEDRSIEMENSGYILYIGFTYNPAL